MNIHNNVHVPSDALSYEYILNRQSNSEYLLNNITRCAIIFNYIKNKTDVNNMVENVFDEFCAIQDPASIPNIFLNNFETFMHIYLLERFGRMYNIFISEAELKSITYPIHAFCSGTTIVVLYSLNDLKKLINNISLYQYMYFNEKHFLMPRKGCENDENKYSLLVDRDNVEKMETNSLQNTLNDIQKAGIFNTEIKTNLLPSFNSYCNKVNNNSTLSNTLPDIKNTSNYKITNTMPLKDNKNPIVSTDEDFIQIQANFAKIWSQTNQIPLTYLIMITQILEISIRPILCTILTNTVEKNTTINKVRTDQLYKEFLSSFTHSISIDLNAHNNHKNNKATDFKYTNFLEFK